MLAGDVAGGVMRRPYEKGDRHVRSASRFAFQATQDKSLRYRASPLFRNQAG